MRDAIQHLVDNNVAARGGDIQETGEAKKEKRTKHKKVREAREGKEAASATKDFKRVV